MDPITAFGAINWLAIAAATVSAFMLGGIWYGPLFGKPWMALTGVTEETVAGRNQGMIFAGAFVLTFIMVINLAMFIGPETSLAFGAMAGFFTGAFWIAAMLGVIYLFEGRPLKLFLIEGGYAVAALTIMGAILGAF